MGGCRAYNKGSVEISGTVLEKPAKKGESPVCENSQIVALEVVGSNPIIPPISKLTHKALKTSMTH
jgi:hypothetical protein